MDKKLEKYFSLSDTTYIVGGVILVVSFFLLWLGMAYNYWMFLVGIVAAVTGIVMFIVGSIGRIGAEDIDKVRDVRLENFCREQLEDVRLAKRMAQHIEPTYIVQYDREGEGLESRRGRDGIWRTSIVSAFRIFYLHDGIIVARHSFSVLGGFEEILPATEYKYEELEKAEIVRKQVKLVSGKNTYTVTRAEMVITAKDGTVVLRSQISDDMDADNIATTLNRTISHGSAV